MNIPSFLPAAIGAAFLGALVAPTLPAAEPIEAASEPAAVTVFNDRAEVVRRATVDLAAGRNQISVRGLPVRLDGESLRCSVVGEPAARVVDFQTDRYRSERNLRAELAELDREHSELERQIRAKEDAIVALRRRGELLSDYRGQVLARIRADLVDEAPPVERWRESLGFVAAQARDGQVAVREVEVALYELKRRIAENRERVELLNAGDDRPEARRVRLWVDSPGAGRREIELRYLVRGSIRWGMHYVLRLDRDEERIRVEALIAVAQDSDEDWRGAELSFSTRKPARGLRPPRLEPLRLAAREAPSRQEVEVIVAPRATDDGDRPEDGEPVGGAGIEEVDRPDDLEDPGELVRPGTLEIRTVQSLADELVYRGAEPVDVPADGRPVLVPLGTWEGPARWRLECLPEVFPAAYVRADFRNPTDARLPPGPARAYLDGRSIGHLEFPGCAVGGTARCAFGVAADILVHRENRPVEQIATREAGETVGHTWRYATTVELRNVGDGERRITVTESLPISDLESVEVGPGVRTTEPTRRRADRLDWDVTLPADGQRRIDLVFTIRMREDRSGRKGDGGKDP